MTDRLMTARDMTDRQLVDCLMSQISKGNALCADLLAALGEVDARKLYHAEACSSMFVYATDVLGFSESTRLH